jgi:hypothetical protein
VVDDGECLIMHEATPHNRTFGWSLDDKTLVKGMPMARKIIDHALYMLIKLIEAWYLLARHSPCRDLHKPKSAQVDRALHGNCSFKGLP